MPSRRNTPKPIADSITSPAFRVEGREPGRSAPSTPDTGSSWLRAAALQLLVFTSGAVLMGLEIAGSRVLAPYFGNSVFVWGSLISVFLIALSLGYYLGGMLADRFPEQGLLSAICVLVSIMIFSLAYISAGICQQLVDRGLNQQYGPLVAALILFLPPSFGMGMVSPFAIRLATQSVTSVGKISGTLYAISTAGSILGTLITTFVLIPSIGLGTILKALGITLMIVAIITLPFWRSRQAVISAMLLLGMSLGSKFLRDPIAMPFGNGFEAVYTTDTPYHTITVYDSADRRLMCFDRLVESAIIKQAPYPSAARYPHYFHLAHLAAPQVKQALFIGAGGGVGPRSFHLHDPDTKIDVVDIDPKVLELAYSHFHLDRHPNIRTFAEDGRMFVRQTTANYDSIILDASTVGGRIPFHLVTKEFLELCRSKLTSEGVFVMNLNSAIEGPLSRIFHSMYRTFDEVFPNVYVFALQHPPERRDESRNIMLVGMLSADALAPEQWAVRAGRFRSNSYVGQREMTAVVKNLLVDLPDFSAAPVFTDDYTPIDTMAAHAGGH